MEKNPYPKKFPINLKELPPIVPSTITTTPSRVKQVTRQSVELAEKDFGDETRENGSKGEDSSLCSFKHIDPDKVNTKKKNKSKSRDGIGTFQSDSINEGSPKTVSAKSLLYEICDANHWKPPLFQCCQQEGPCHLKSFTFKVVVEIKGDEDVVLECFGGPQLRKKTAEEHAAAGALCYLKHVGYS